VGYARKNSKDCGCDSGTAACCKAETKQDGLDPDRHVPSLLPGGKTWKLIWHDEFDGDTLDRSKWDYRLHLMHKRHKTFSDGGAVLDGKGNLLLTLQEKDGQFYSPHLQTGSNYMDQPEETYPGTIFNWPIGKLHPHRFVHKYGYYECRCKLPTQPGWWAAFWLQSPIIGSTLDPAFSGVEMDIMETFDEDGNISVNQFVTHNNHWNGYGPDGKRTGNSGNRELKETPDGFHVFGLDWSRDGLVYYIDGEVSWCVKEPVSDCEQFVLLSTECMGYRNGDNPSEDLLRAKLPDSFIVDYVRVFDEVEA
jgi:beta-glucanase (GH16 family)